MLIRDQEFMEESAARLRDAIGAIAAPFISKPITPTLIRSLEAALLAEVYRLNMQEIFVVVVTQRESTNEIDVKLKHPDKHPDKLLDGLEQSGRTDEEIDQLKAQWLGDPCWDLEDTEGFELHRIDLLIWRISVENDRLRSELIRAKAQLAGSLTRPRPRLYTFSNGSEIDVDKYIGVDATANGCGALFQFRHGFTMIRFIGNDQRESELAAMRSFRDGTK